MTQALFIAADPASWIARGRPPKVAEAIAHVWRAWPDLPASAPAEARSERFRQRVAAMRPINEALASESDRRQQSSNFAFVAAKTEEGEASDHDRMILQGREAHGYGWMEAVRYADGWQAAQRGWPHACHHDGSDMAVRRGRQAAYDRGFAEGGGDIENLFDTARRGNLAALRADNAPIPPRPARLSRPLPSAWPQPSDRPRSSPWHRRLAIVTNPELVAAIFVHPGAEAMTIIGLDAWRGFIQLQPGCDPILAAIGNRARGDLPEAAQVDQLRALVAAHDFDDILVAGDDAQIAIVDKVAGVLPLCRTMERTRHTPLLQRGQLRLWLDRGREADDNVGAGHIRWGKVIHGLTGKLGEFTARYAGPVQPRGHLIRVEMPSGHPADGYATSSGAPLSPEIVISNKSYLRREMSQALRAFCGATQLMAA